MGIGRRVLLGALAVVVLIVGGSWAVDFAHASAVHMVSRVAPSDVPADGQTAATVTLRITNADGSPRVGDLLELLDQSQNPGTLSPYRLLTNRHGEATFTYIPEAANAFISAAPAHILVTDTSLGSLVEIDKMMLVTINVVDPSKLRKKSHGTHS
jgi:hypothetical protein